MYLERKRSCSQFQNWLLVRCRNQYTMTQKLCRNQIFKHKIIIVSGQSWTVKNPVRTQ